MLDLNPEIVCTIIAKSRLFQSKDDVSLSEVPVDPTGEGVLDLLHNYADDMTYQEVTSAIADLEPDQQMSLVALMWLGRGDFDVEDWGAALEEARNAWTPHTAQYLIATPLMADYLEEGLAELGYSCEQ